MRYPLAIAALLLPLAGCVVPPPGPYAYPQPGYPAPYPQPEFGYPGYAYNDGSPTLVVEGVTWPLIFYGGGWGYWDGYHRWHGAPGPVGSWLSTRHPGGMGYRPWGGGAYGRPVGVGGGYPFGQRAYGPSGGGVRPAYGGQGQGRGPAVVPRASTPARAAPSRSHEEHH